MTACYYHVTSAFQSESTLYSCLNVKELLAGNRRDIWSLSDNNGIQTHKHLGRKGTLNYLAQLAIRLRTKWLWIQIPLLSLKENDLFEKTMIMKPFFDLEIENKPKDFLVLEDSR